MREAEHLVKVRLRLRLRARVRLRLRVRLRVRVRVRVRVSRLRRGGQVGELKAPGQDLQRG